MTRWLCFVAVLSCAPVGCFPDPPAAREGETAEEVEPGDAADSGGAGTEVDAAGAEVRDGEDVAETREEVAEVAEEVEDTGVDSGDGQVTVDAEVEVEVVDTQDAETQPEVEVVEPECDGDEDCGHLAALCHAGVCDGGTCVASSLTGDACDDGLACTEDDVCDDGACKGTAIVCSARDQCHDVGECDPDTGICSDPPLSDIGCDDGSACTSDDGCVAGVCRGTEVVCVASDQCHEVGVCNPSTGVCSNPMKPDQTECDDGLKCTQADECVAGSCSGIRIVCSATSGCSQAQCESETGLCLQTPREDGIACDDGDPCTVEDTCAQGTCEPGPPPQDAAGDWVAAARSASSTTVSGIAAMGDGVIAVINVDGPDALQLDSIGTLPFDIAPPSGATSYVVLARYSNEGQVEWGHPILWAEGVGDTFVAGRGGPYIHGGSGITVGFAAGGNFGMAGLHVPLGADSPGAVGALRLTATGVPVWIAFVDGWADDFERFQLPFVCASANGRVGVVFTAFQDEAQSFRTTINYANLNRVDLTAETDQGRRTVVVATFTTSGGFVGRGWVRVGEEMIGASCAIDDSGVVFISGLADGTTISAQEGAAGTAVEMTVAFQNQQIGWLATFSPSLEPLAVAGGGGSRIGGKNGFGEVSLSANGSRLHVGGVFAGSVSLVSSTDNIVRTFPGDVASNDAIYRLVLAEVDLGLKLVGGSRALGSDFSWIERVDAGVDDILVTGGGRDLDWGTMLYTDDFDNYFVASVDPVTHRPRWGVPISPLDSPITGDYTLAPPSVDTISAAKSSTGAIVIAGSVGQTAEIGWAKRVVVSTSQAAMGFIGLINSSMELACSFE